MRFRFAYCFAILLPFAVVGCSAPPPAASGSAALSARGLMRTPEGVLPIACAQTVPSGTHVDMKALPGCPTLRRLRKPPRPNPVYTPPSSWVMDSLSSNPVPAVHMTATFIVPSEPATPGDQTVFLFPGLRPADGSSVLQPVLQWGNGTPSWEMGSWACDAISGGPCPNSELKAVHPGDEIFGEILGSDCTAAGVCKWQITTTDRTTGESTTLNADHEDKSYTLLFGGVLESYDIQQCSDYPANGKAIFSETDFYDAQGNLLAPNWSPQYDVTTYCKLAIHTTPTSTELDFPE